MTTENTSAKEEHRHHTYTSNDIPWYVRLVWILFWAFVIYYSLTYFIPAIDKELLSPP
ncbi:MAG: hypothetical protein R3C18_11250 [Planctomycetaceae bacterium]